MLKDLPILIATGIVEEIIQDKSGRFIELNHENEIVLWYNPIKNEYVIHKVVYAKDKWVLEYGNYFENSIDGMKKFIDRCSKNELDVDVLFKEHSKIPNIIEMDWKKLPKNLQNILTRIGADLTPCDPVYGLNAYLYSVNGIKGPATDINYYDDGEFDEQTIDILNKLYMSINKYDYIMFK